VLIGHGCSGGRRACPVAAARLTPLAGTTHARARAQPRCCCTDGSWVTADAAGAAANCCCGDALNLPSCCPNLGSSLCARASCSALAIGTIFLLILLASCCLGGCLVVRRGPYPKPTLHHTLISPYTI